MCVFETGVVGKATRSSGGRNPEDEAIESNRMREGNERVRKM